MSYELFSENLKNKHNNNIEKQKISHPERKIPFGYNYFENRDCCFYPCHDLENMSCLFCKCPQYYTADCLGIQHGYATILENGYKDCSNCDLPHKIENYEVMMFHVQ